MIGTGTEGAAPDAAAPDGSDKTVAAVLGEIAWLMTQSPAHRDLPLSALVTRVMPAVLGRRFRMFYQGPTPVAVVLHASVSAAVATKLDAQGPAAMGPDDWASGPDFRVVEVVAPFGHTEAFVAETVDALGRAP